MFLSHINTQFLTASSVFLLQAMFIKVERAVNEVRKPYSFVDLRVDLC
jgi:hypothetical protein